MRTTQPARGRRSENICSIYFNTQHPTNTWQTVRHYLPQVQLKSHTTIHPTSFTTSLKQTFRNTSKDVIPEARYTFPLYDGVAVSSYTITYSDTTLRGVVQQKDVAKKTYETAVEKGETAGLLESLPAGVFGTTLGNLPAETEVNVDIVYCGELKHDASIDGLRYMLPTSIAPRYGDFPGEVMESTVTNKGGISIVVDVDMGKNVIKKIQSPSHPIAVSMGAISIEDSQSRYVPSKASTSLTLGTTELAGDFILQLLIDDISKPQAIVEKHPELHTRAIMATLVPKFNLNPSYPEIVFIADQSGSMQGAKNDALVSALRIFIKSLPIGVRFNICAFGTRYKTLWPKSQAYNETNMKAAIDFVGTFRADYGGTELLEPVESAFEHKLGDMPLEVMLLTDGEIWSEHMLFEFINTQITTNKVDARVFALGIGDDVSHTLVEGVARAGNGFAQFVTQDERLDRKVVRMLKAALYPHLTDRTMEVHYKKNQKSNVTAEDDEFELVEKVDHCLDISAAQAKQESPSIDNTTSKSRSFYDDSVDLDKPVQSEGVDRHAHLPTFAVPNILQAPSEVPSLFPFNRTTIYLLLSADAPQELISSVTLRAKSPQGPLELTIEVNEKEVVDTTIHQLAARKAIQELEEGRGWLQAARTSTGSFVKDDHESRFDELVECEAVRLGESYQVAGKWTSFVAVNDDGSQMASPTAAPPPRLQTMNQTRMLVASASSVWAMRHAAAPTQQQQDSSLLRKKKVAKRSCAPPDLQQQQQQQQQQQRQQSYAAHLPARYAPAPPPQTLLSQSLKVDALQVSSQPSACLESSSSDDDMGFALIDDDPVPRQTTPPSEDPLHSLIRLQNFSGSWDWNDDLFSVVMGKGKKPEYAAAFGSEQVQATLLAVAYLETRLANCKDVWEMVVEKAKAWVGSQAGQGSVDALVETAKGLL